MITGFKDRETEKIWQGGFSRRLPSSIQAVARRKLRMLSNAHSLEDLRVPPANRLEALNLDSAVDRSILIPGCCYVEPTQKV